MTRASWWRWARPLGGAAILGVLLAGLGTDAFVDGVRATDARTLLLGAAVAALTTACTAWRWRLVARGLDADLSMPSAVAACYRAQFLNVTLPGGVLGDLDRGVHHGRAVDDVGRGLRGVAWERTSGQVVLAGVTAVGLLYGPSLDAPTVLVPLGVLAVVGLVLLAVARAGRGSRGGTRGTGVGSRVVRVVAADARALRRPAALAGILVASLAVLAGHVATFLLAAHTVGVRMPVRELVPLALLVLLVAAVPLNLAGWGPREGAAAWVFAAAGAGATQGVAVAVAYGVIVVVATLPGAVLLLAGRSRLADTREVTAHG